MDTDEPRLESILNDMLEAATKVPGVVIARTLSRGLRVAIKTEGNLTKLQISRGKTRPGKTEWNTIINALPFPISVTCKSFDHGGRKYLSGEWPTQERLL